MEYPWQLVENPWNSMGSGHPGPRGESNVLDPFLKVTCDLYNSAFICQYDQIESFWGKMLQVRAWLKAIMENHICFANFV